MRRFLMSASACLFLLSAFLARPASAGIALGFHSTTAPLGIRASLGEYYAVDLGVGFLARNGEKNDATAFDIGLPLTVKEFDRLHVLLRPGVLFENFEGRLGTTRVRTLSAEVEGEAFLFPQLSVSAALGVARQTVDPAGAGNNETAWVSTGGEFTNVGFHLYLFK